MRDKFKFKSLFSELLILLLAVSFIALFWDLWNHVYRKIAVNPFYEKGAVLFMFEYLFIFEIFLRLYEGHKIDNLRISDIVYSQTLALVISNFIIFIQICLIVKKIVNPLELIYMTIKQFIIIIIWAWFSKKIFISIFTPIKMLVIYGENSIDNFIKKMNKHRDKYEVSTVINVKEGLDTIFKRIMNYDAILIYDIDSVIRNKIIKYCYAKSTKVYITPKLSDIIVSNSDKLHIFDTPLLVIENFSLTLFQSFIKRIVDILLSLTALIILSPVMIIIAIIIKLYDGGSIIYKQKRLTVNNKEFYIYKFRSMVEDAEKDGVAKLAMQNDNRITPIGTIIRKIRFDELPQLINILVGDMSIVGPRPERPEILKEYVEKIPEFGFRTKVKAGLTGYAQVMGKYNTSAYDKLKLDLMYIEDYSLLLDLKLILKTIKILFISESTDGVESNSEREKSENY